MVWRQTILNIDIFQGGIHCSHYKVSAVASDQPLFLEYWQAFLGSNYLPIPQQSNMSIKKRLLTIIARDHAKTELKHQPQITKNPRQI